MLEVAKPALEDGIELGDDGLQATATCAAGLLADLIPKSLSAFRAHPASTGLKPIAQKFKPLSFLPAVAHPGLVRM
jgi:hypothetical protein